MNPRFWLAAIACLLLVSCDSYAYRSNKEVLWFILLTIVGIFVIVRWTKAEPPRATDATHRHRYHHFEDFTLSSQAFYEDLAAIIRERYFPKVSMNVMAIDTGGFLSPKRDYLRITNSHLVFYVCAAPFGKDFFISYWLVDMPEGCLTTFSRRVLGIEEPPKTFFEVDTEAIFLEGITAAIQRAIHRATETRGLRAITEGELIPKLLN